MILVAPKDLNINSKIQARDPAGLWYNAYVIRKTGRGASLAAWVRYAGFGKSQDEKFTASKGGLRLRIPKPAMKAQNEDRRHLLRRHLARQ